MSTDIGELELSIRGIKMLRDEGIQTVEQLRQTDLEILCLGLPKRFRVEIDEALALYQNHLDRELQPELWQFVLANKEAIEALRKGRATIQLTLNLKEAA